MTNSEKNTIENNSFFSFLLILLKWKKFLIINFLVVLVISTVVAFLLPKIYYSAASVLPPKEDMSMLGGGMGGLNSVMKEFSAIKSIGSLGNKSTYNYLVILNSREVAEKVIKKFNLMEVYGQSNSLDKTLKIFRSNTIFEIQEEGNLEVGFYDENPQRAADIANYLVTVLNERSYELSVTEAQDNSKFLEKRVSENNDSLTLAENRLKEYMEKHGIMTLPEQTGALAESGSRIYAEKVSKEIELEYLKKVLSPDNKMLLSAQLQLDVINKQLDNVPNQGIEIIRLYRDILIRTKILEFLRPMLEQSIYQEKKDVPVIVVVDAAKVPEYKAKPKRIIVIGSSVLGWLFISILIVLMIESWRKFKNEKPGNYELLKNAFRK